MAKAPHPTSVLIAEGMAPPSPTLLAERKPQSNGHSSPSRGLGPHPRSPAGKPNLVTSPSTTETIHPSPSHQPATVSNSHAGKPHVEGYMKTDDRMRLAKERREEKERCLVVREQALREKDRRARLQYERTVEERWRRLEEQRQKEELRRAAVEEKRRQRLEEEKERLEALMKRSLERSLQLEQRSRRWTRGPMGALQGDSENAPPPFSAASAFPRPLPAASESAPCSPHRSPYRSSVSRVDHRAGGHRGSQSTPNTPKKERLRRERRTASPAFGFPVRRVDSPAMVINHSGSPTHARLTSRIRNQSPGAARQYHSSPKRRYPVLPNKSEDKTDGETSTNKVSGKNKSDANSPDKNLPSDLDLGKKPSTNGTPQKRSPKTETCKNDTPGKNCCSDKLDFTGDGLNKMSPKVDVAERKSTRSSGDDLDEKRKAPPTGKTGAGTTSAEEASKLLAERRRQARAQRELQDKRRSEDEDRLRKQEEQEQLGKEATAVKIQEEQEQLGKEATAEKIQEEQEQLGKEATAGRTQEMREEEEKKQREEREKELQAQMDKEREKVLKVQVLKVQVQKDADLELQKQLEEEERQLRKKRIEEIMKRTRRTDAEVKEGQASPPGDAGVNVQTNAEVNMQTNAEVKVQSNGHVNGQSNGHVNGQSNGHVNGKSNGQVYVQSNGQVNVPAIGKAEFQTDEQISDQRNKQQDDLVKREEATTNTQNSVQASKAVDQVPPLKTVVESGIRNAEQVNVQQSYKENFPKQGENTSAETRALTLVDKLTVDPKEIIQVNGRDSGAEGSKQQTLQVKVTLSVPEGREVKGGSKGETTGSGQTPPTPLISLELLNVKGNGSSGGVQSMEVSPVSREELISIPEFSPVSPEVRNNGMSNAHALEDLLDLTGHAYPRLPPVGNHGDCNKNLMEAVCTESNKLLSASPPSANKLNIK